MYKSAIFGLFYYLSLYYSSILYKLIASCLFELDIK